jgi:hypothetical protein
MRDLREDELTRVYGGGGDGCNESKQNQSKQNQSKQNQSKQKNSPPGLEKKESKNRTVLPQHVERRRPQCTGLGILLCVTGARPAASAKDCGDR